MFTPSNLFPSQLNRHGFSFLKFHKPNKRYPLSTPITTHTKLFFSSTFSSSSSSSSSSSISTSSLNEWSSYKVSIYRILTATLFTTVTFNFIREKLSLHQLCYTHEQRLKELEFQVQQRLNQLSLSNS